MRGEFYESEVLRKILKTMKDYLSSDYETAYRERF